MTFAARIPVSFVLPALALIAGCATVTAPATSVVTTEGVTISAADSSFAFQANKPIGTPFAITKCPKLPIGVDESGLVEQMGGKRVRITYPGVAEPLHGVLLLCKIPKSAVASDEAAYRIQVPKSYVDATEGGKISMVFEAVGAGEEKALSWILYISRTPFATVRPPS
jgi:hypothetical protein